VEEGKAGKHYAGHEVRYFPKRFVFAVQLVSITDKEVRFREFTANYIYYADYKQQRRIYECNEI
jgi:hypothetical protein